MTVGVVAAGGGGGEGSNAALQALEAGLRAWMQEQGL